MKNQYHDIKFISSAAAVASWPLSNLPEVVLMGRSNVGKSSFINRLFNRRNLAYVGQTPGKTRLLNFYQVADSFMVVDAPGYGYAKRSRKELAHYQALMEDYLNKRENLKAGIILIDMRRLATEDDRLMLEYLAYLKLPVLVILTKGDKLSYQKQLSMKQEIAQDLNLPEVSVIPFNAQTGGDYQTIFNFIEATLKLDK